MKKRLEDISVHAFIKEHGIKNEKGEPIDFKDHRFLFAPYADLNAKQVYLKAAQVGASTMQVIKSLWMAKKFGVNIIYTLPTESDLHTCVVKRRLCNSAMGVVYSQGANYGNQQANGNYSAYQQLLGLYSQLYNLYLQLVNHKSNSNQSNSQK